MASRHNLFKRTPYALLPVFILPKIVLNTMVRMVYPFLPVFARGLGVSIDSLSHGVALRSLASGLGPFLASVADSRGRKAGMLLGLLLFILGTLSVAIFPSYPAFVLALVLTILGNFVFIPSMQAYMGDHIPYARRGLALALTEMGWSLAFIIGVPLVGLAIARWGWRAPFPLLAGAGVLGFLLLAVLVPPDGEPSPDHPGLRKNLLAVLAYTPALAGIAVGILSSAANEMVNLVFGVWLEDTQGLNIAALGAASIVIGVSELAGEGGVGMFSDRFGKARSVGVGLLLNSACALALPFLGASREGALAGLFLFYLTFEYMLVSSLAMMTEVLPPARATLMSIYVGSTALGRGLSALFATRLYEMGFLANGAAAVALNLLAFAALIKVAKVVR